MRTVRLVRRLALGGSLRRHANDAFAYHLFFMGDNRDNSADSRSAALGPVHRKFVMGRAQFVLFSLNIQQTLTTRPGTSSQTIATSSWNITNPFRWGRFFKGIR